MNATVLTLTLSAILFGLCSAVQAQEPTKIVRIGFLPGGDAKNAQPRLKSFRDGLRDLGYDQKNILIVERYIEKNLDEYPDLFSELLQLKVDLLLVEPLAAIHAAKKLSKTIPIVIVTSVDPVANGIINSLARPGANITGLATLSRELSGKRLELFKEVVSRISRVGILGDPDTPVWPITLKEYEVAARALKIQLQSLEVRSTNPDLEQAFQIAVKKGVNGVVMITNPVLGRHRQQIAELAISNHLPLISDGTGYVEAGTLMSYSANIPDQYRRSAVFVDKILKGTKPADLPVEQPKKFEFVINLKTAKQIGLAIQPNVLARADRVIR